MSLEQAVMARMKEAMKAKDEPTLRGLRAIKAALLLLKTSGEATVSADAELKMLQKLVKQRKDAMAIYEQQNRADLAQKEAEEIAVIEQFLPQPLSEAELRAALQSIIAETGATSAADLGKVMAAASKQLAGRADGKTMNALVRELLGAG